MSEKFYGTFDADGKPQGLYTTNVYPEQTTGRNEKIPAAAIEISGPDWQALIADQIKARYVGGQVVHVEPPPIPPTPPNPVLLEAQRANARLDAGVMAALDVAIAVKTAMQNIPDTFSNANFIASKIQLDALTEAMVAMLQGQAALPDAPGIIKPPVVKPP